MTITLPKKQKQGRQRKKIVRRVPVKVLPQIRELCSPYQKRQVKTDLIQPSQESEDVVLFLPINTPKRVLKKIDSIINQEKERINRARKIALKIALETVKNLSEQELEAVA